MDEVRQQNGADGLPNLLHATFKHYYEMALHHHTKAGTTSNILLLIVGAVIAFVGSDGAVEGFVDLAGGIAVVVIGLFGMVWARKQHERYFYWRRIALGYQEALTKILPGYQPESHYANKAAEAATSEFGRLLGQQIYDRHLWVLLHLMVILLGVGLTVLALVVNG